MNSEGMLQQIAQSILSASKLCRVIYKYRSDRSVWPGSIETIDAHCAFINTLPIMQSYIYNLLPIMESESPLGGRIAMRRSCMATYRYNCLCLLVLKWRIIQPKVRTVIKMP